MNRTAAALISLTGISATLVAARARRPRRLRVDAIDAPVTIARDSVGVPHVTAGSRNDAMFGLGYALAEDRLFQMDTLRRTALGRLSELAGPSTLPNDRLMRLVGIDQISRAMIKDANESARAALDAFAAGVNTRLERGGLPLEFRILRYRPEPWRPEDSAAIVRLMGWSLSAFHEHELTGALLRETIGDEWADAMYAGRNPGTPLVVRELSRPLSQEDSARRPILPFPHGGASNAWAVSAERSLTGFPILANDPHLAYTNPSIWCEASIDAPGLSVAGLTLPGVPGLAFGRTPTFAWGFTAAMISQTFLYREHLDVRGERVKDGDGWANMSVRTEDIAVKGQPTETLTIRSTPRGPLLSDLEPEWSKDPFSLYWTGIETQPDELDAWIALSTSRTVDDVLRVRESMLSPTLNMAAADADGDIASIGIGRWPDREPFAGLLDPASHPPRYIPPAEMPIERNPVRGWIASANNPIVGADYPYKLHGFYEPPYRIRRISAELGKVEQHSVADMRRLQLDQYSLHGAECTPLLLQHGGGAIPDWARADLARWDFQSSHESRATLLFQVFYRQWVEQSLRHRLPVTVVQKMMAGLGIGDMPMAFCDRLLGGEFAGWWLDDAMVATVQASFRAALDWIGGQLGSDHETWTWGAVHTVTWQHPFGMIDGKHQRFVKVGPFPLGGDRTTVWPTGYDAAQLYSVTGGPSMRLLTDLRRPERTWVTNTLGQNGRPLSRHYRDQVEDFIAGRSHAIWGQPSRTRVVIEPI